MFVVINLILNVFEVDVFGMFSCVIFLVFFCVLSVNIVDFVLNLIYVLCLV